MVLMLDNLMQPRDVPDALYDYFLARGWTLSTGTPPVVSPVVTSWAGKTGAVTPVAADITDLSASSALWSPNVAVLANTVRLAPTGEVIKRTADGTTRGSYDATEAALWTVVSSGGAADPAAIDLRLRRRLNLVEDGNSLMLGSGLPVALSLGSQLGDGLVNATVTNFAVHGQTTDSMRSDAVSQIDAALVPGALNLLAAWEGTNSLTDPAVSAQDAFNSMKLYIDGRLAAGYDGVVVATVLPRTDFTEQKRSDYNTALRNYYASNTKVHIADLDTDPVLGDPTQLTNPYVYFDGLHLSATTVRRVAALFRVGLQKFGAISSQTYRTLAPAPSVITIPASDFVLGGGATGPTRGSDVPGYWYFPDAANGFVVAARAFPRDWQRFTMHLIFGTEGVGAVQWQINFAPTRLGSNMFNNASSAAATLTTTTDRTPLRVQFGVERTIDTRDSAWTFGIRRNNAVTEDGTAGGYFYGLELVRFL